LKVRLRVKWNAIEFDALREARGIASDQGLQLRRCAACKPNE
jgi:hypothetical protein